MEQTDFNNNTSTSHNSISLRREWPQLGRALYRLEHDAVDANPALTEEQKREQRQRARDTVFAQCALHEEQYEAFEVVRLGRAVELVGNPYYAGADSQEKELPYTGLEGYYAGSQQQADRPGLTPEQIIVEEAGIGLELLNDTKKQCIETHSWAQFTRIRHALAQVTAGVEVEDLYMIGMLWTKVVHRVRDRIYQNPEYQETPVEEAEALFSSNPALANDPHLLAAYQELRQRASENVQAAQPVYKRLAVFANRLAEYTHFRDQTYELLRRASRATHAVDYGVADEDFVHATIIETRTLPRLAGRSSHPPYLVHLIAEQLEGYLFLSQLGEIGGNPLVRCVLTQEEY